MKYVMRHEIVCKLALQNTNLLHPNTLIHLTENPCTYTCCAELEWLDEEDVEVHCTLQVQKESSPITSGSAMNASDDVGYWILGHGSVAVRKSRENPRSNSLVAVQA